MVCPAIIHRYPVNVRPPVSYRLRLLGYRRLTAAGGGGEEECEEYNVGRIGELLLHDLGIHMG